MLAGIVISDELEDGSEVIITQSYTSSQMAVGLMPRGAELANAKMVERERTCPVGDQLQDLFEELDLDEATPHDQAVLGSMIRELQEAEYALDLDI